MAGSKSDLAELEVLRIFTGQALASLTLPLTVWLALASTAPTDATPGTEITTNGMTRISSAGKWAAPSAGSVTTNADIVWAAVTTSSITIVGVMAFDASSSGNYLWYYDVSSKTVNVGDTPRIVSGGITYTEA